MSFVDKTIRCRECGAEFIFSAGEQEFYNSRGLLNEPGRCPQCRQTKRDRDGRGVGGGGGRAREMHSVTCASCGQETEVPFLPTNGRPVYCRDCFQNQRAVR